MTYAAKHNEIFHLWWHPHNFGVNLDKNIDMLRAVLQHYIYLNKKYGMRSLNMEGVSEYSHGRCEWLGGTPKWIK
ncbi:MULTISPECIES: hypothetical protein [Pseudoalteromonas]|uniref:hypothetical protein n=1 Tax=Pseudoalteromonas TaxID=53246 RepID=UPI000A52F1CB|nr:MULTISPECIES: hypothetical protein [Pseudoalteromonas]